jgi:hypothetical protein
MDWLLFFMVIRDVPKASRAALVEQLLPMALPGPSQRLAFAAIGAEQQFKRQARTEQELVVEAIAAADFQTADALNEFPALLAAFKRLPVAVQSTIFPPTDPT